MVISEEVCFYIAKRLVLSRRAGDAGARKETFDEGSYREWRTSELRRQFLDNFDVSEIRHKDVLDFGCGEGGLSFLLAEFEPKSITGIDVIPDRVASAQKQALEGSQKVPLRFFLAGDDMSIDLPDSSVDVLLCFDVLEHIMNYEAIFREWWRVLRPGGRVLIWWVPWFHPYGHHVESLVPIPWAHVFFSDKSIIKTCARIYDMAEFMPRIWDMDESGRKKPNKWSGLDRLPDVNRLTMHRFETLIRNTGFTISRREAKGFGGGWLAKTTHSMLHMPVVREFITASMVYVLEKKC